MESLPSKPDKMERQCDGEPIYRYYLPPTDSTVTQLPDIDQGLINNDVGRKAADRRKRKKNRKRKGDRHRRVVLPGSTLEKDEATKEWVEDGQESPKLYQLLPRLDLGVEEPGEGVTREGDLGTGRVVGVTGQAQGSSEEELHRVKKFRKFSEMTPRYVDHYKALLKKRLRHPDDLITSPRGETEHYIKINTPRRPLIGRVKNDSNGKGLPSLESEDILLPAVGKPSKRLLKPDQNSQKIREDILKMLDLREDPASPKSAKDTSSEIPGIAVAEDGEGSEDIHNKPWFCIVEDSASSVSAASTTRDETLKERKPLERRVDDVIKEYEGNPGLVPKGAARKKLGAVMSPRRLGELLGCPSPIRMENRFNHYL